MAADTDSAFVRLSTESGFFDRSFIILCGRSSLDMSELLDSRRLRLSFDGEYSIGGDFQSSSWSDLLGVELDLLGLTEDGNTTLDLVVAPVDELALVVVVVVVVVVLNDGS